MPTGMFRDCSTGALKADGSPQDQACFDQGVEADNLTPVDKAVYYHKWADKCPIQDDPLCPTGDSTCSPKIKEFYTGTPEDPNYDHLSTVQHVSVFHWPNKDNCQHVIAQGNGQDYLYQFLFHCDTLEMTHAQYWKHTNEYAWRTFNHESCIPEGETQACGGDPCLICKEVAKEEEALGEVTHKCHVDFSKPECAQQSFPFPAEVTYSPALLDACFPAATVEIEDDSAPSSTGCCYEFKKFKDGRQESYCFESSKTIGSQAECPEGSQ